MVNALTPKHLAEKRAGFHELFFDLIFVYAIQKIAHVILTTQNGSISADLFFQIHRHEFVLMVNVVSSNIFYKSIWSSYIQRRLVYDV